MALTATVRHCKAHHCQSRLLEGCLAAPARAPPESRPSRLCPRGPPASVGVGSGEGGRHRPAGSSEGESPRTRFVRKHSVDFAIAPKSPANFYEQMCNQKKKKKKTKNLHSHPMRPLETRTFPTEESRSAACSDARRGWRRRVGCRLCSVGCVPGFRLPLSLFRRRGGWDTPCPPAG